MNRRLNLIIASAGLSVFSLLATAVQAEATHYQCTYTHAVFTAPFMKTPGTRDCPEEHCKYAITIDGSSGTINGVSGFNVEQDSNMVKLSRTAKDPIMGGMDTTTLTINKTDMTFEAVKTTTPSVTLTTKGRCS
ncbi:MULTISPECIES: hypothetical protein [unclassified Neptuniibacter]|jgi:hypothetical protein|uniref:hypothetical protein n=1 Tax=unclassified Neptuniibacter TaxID=2630693 RepID=UPI0026E32D5F|nr:MULTISPECIES: hypothetical protein [unclassified Neptuniibacter]MDO6513398.1 hypothetical protein [Neptuniibacter sp. 2_MG-2023]MDO6593927.1 hypothetical protein [Neptuniibacter sp. 1_MG-2023]